MQEGSSLRLLRQGGVVANLGHAQAVPNIARARLENLGEFALVQRFVKVA